jgi:hypothetical protein
MNKLDIKYEGKDDDVFVAETMAKHTLKINELIDAHNEQEDVVLELGKTIKFINKDNKEIEKKIEKHGELNDFALMTLAKSIEKNKEKIDFIMENTYEGTRPLDEVYENK